LYLLRVRHTRLAFEDVTDVRVEIGPSPDDSAAISCRLSLVTASAVVPLTASYGPYQERYNAMRDTVLELVFRDGTRPAAVDPVRMLVKEGRIIDAVAILRMRDGLYLTTASARVDEPRNAPTPERPSAPAAYPADAAGVWRRTTRSLSSDAHSSDSLGNPLYGLFALRACDRRKPCRMEFGGVRPHGVSGAPL